MEKKKASKRKSVNGPKKAVQKRSARKSSRSEETESQEEELEVEEEEVEEEEKEEEEEEEEKGELEVEEEKEEEEEKEKEEEEEQEQEQEQEAKKAIAVRGDVSKEADVKAIFDAAIQAFGHVNIVIHLAGILLSSYPTLEQTSAEDWERTMSVNATGTFLVLKEAAQRIVGGGKGRIVTTSSSMVHVLKPGYGAYVASKAAVETLTKIMAKELRGRAITANCVAPGPVATDMFFAGKDEALVESFRDAPPLQRLATPHDIAPLILFLVSDAGEWVNGQVIRANGGLAI